MNENEKNVKQVEEVKEIDWNKQMEKFATGTLKLTKPIQDGENVFKELKWDFFELTGAEYVAAMDRGEKTDAFRVSATQALSLFATAAAKATGTLDATDIRTRICGRDAQKATQIASIFFIASSRAGDMNISGL